jgi:poly-beta-hydroxyalkanoate depolymerase
MTDHQHTTVCINKGGSLSTVSKGFMGTLGFHSVNLVRHTALHQSLAGLNHHVNEAA